MFECLYRILCETDVGLVFSTTYLDGPKIPNLIRALMISSSLSLNLCVLSNKQLMYKGTLVVFLIMSCSLPNKVGRTKAKFLKTQQIVHQYFIFANPTIHLILGYS